MLTGLLAAAAPPHVLDQAAADAGLLARAWCCWPAGSPSCSGLLAAHGLACPSASLAAPGHELNSTRQATVGCLQAPLGPLARPAPSPSYAWAAQATSPSCWPAGRRLSRALRDPLLAAQELARAARAARCTSPPPPALRACRANWAVAC